MKTPMFPLRHRKQLAWMGVAYVAVIGLLLYPAIHEGFSARIILWNCIPPTTGLLVLMSALDKSTHRLIVSTTFAIVSSIVTIFVALAWIFTSLDTDPHSGTTVLAFVFAPLWALGAAAIAALALWFTVSIVSD